MIYGYKFHNNNNKKSCKFFNKNLMNIYIFTHIMC